jgi:hypothetical protein
MRQWGKYTAPNLSQWRHSDSSELIKLDEADERS